METNEGLYAALRKMNRAGVVLLENVGVADKTVLDLARRVGSISHKGSHGEFDVDSQVGRAKQWAMYMGQRVLEENCGEFEGSFAVVAAVAGLLIARRFLFLVRRTASGDERFALRIMLLCITKEAFVSPSIPNSQPKMF